MRSIHVAVALALVTSLGAACRAVSKPAAAVASAPPLLLRSHAWIVVETGAVERVLLEQAGFTIAPTVNEHVGQGTASITVELENGFLELIYPDPSVSVAPEREAGAEKFRQRARWRESGHAPIGLVFDRTPATPESFPFPTWRVHAEWMGEGNDLVVLTPKEATQAASLSISPHSVGAAQENAALLGDPERSAVLRHANGARRLSALRVIAPSAAGLPPAAEWLEQRQLADFEVGNEWLLEVTLDDGVQGLKRDLRPGLPLVLRF